MQDVPGRWRPDAHRLLVPGLRDAQADLMPVVSPEAKRLAFLAALGSCDTVKAACEKSGVSMPMAYAWRKEFPQFHADWLEIRTVRKEALADKGLRAVEQIIDDERHKDRFAASKWAAERVEGANAQRIEVVGSIQHEARLTLADLAQYARVERPVAEGLSGSPRRELPAAREVLAEAADSERAAGGVPAGTEP